MNLHTRLVGVRECVSEEAVVVAVSGESGRSGTNGNGGAQPREPNTKRKSYTDQRGKNLNNTPQET